MFDDIRPYRDNEVVEVIQKLINEQGLQISIASFAMPKFYRLFPKFCLALVKFSLKLKVKKFTDIMSIQLEIAKYMNRLIAKSTDGFSYHGLEKLDMNKPVLFVSNHRDIILDAALVNLALFQNGGSTVEAAVGDNLLRKPWVADLLRLNKCFIVKRSEKTKRAMLTAAKSLSTYIHHAITENKQNIWIAQREGRAKDGIDKTNAAIISMLLLNKEKQMPIGEYLQQLNIVPVAISYEFDPCDNDKAKELCERELTGEYEKSADEDVRSMTQGIIGNKGRIHIEFGSPLQGDFEDSKSVAIAIDQQIIRNYKLWDSNQVAHDKLTRKSVDAAKFSTLKDRMSELNEAQHRWLLTMYANPVFAKLALEQEGVEKQT
jgi:1-acyl-sn-glycerol-3-phosphate acyltransferase